MCGDDSRDIVELPVDDMRQAMRLTDVQRAALDDLANALLKAAQDIKAACPTDVSLTAPNRLATMQQRIEFHKPRVPADKRRRPTSKSSLR